MIQLPEEYKKRIIATFGELGQKWLNSIDSTIKKYEKKFEIEDIRYLTYSTNLIFERIFK